MCWKTSTPPTEPTPAAMLLSTLSTVTENAQFNVTEAGGPVCPHTAVLCNSTAIKCYNGGYVCCDRYSPETHCSCLTGWEPPDCLLQNLDAILGMSSYNENAAGRIGIIVFVFAVLLMIIVVVVVLLKRKVIRPLCSGRDVEQQGSTELPERHVDRRTTDSCSSSLMNSH